jgi:SAP domain
MADELMVYDRLVDLDQVSDMDDEEYEGLLAYAGQWDRPEQADWVKKIKKARGEDVEEEEGGEYDSMSKAELVEAADERGLDSDGTKAEIKARLEEDDASG